MTPQDLLSEPAWRPADLGRPLPACTHAVSVALPRWDDVVGYEEKRPEVLERLACGYPRFVIHPLVRDVAATMAPGGHALPFPSEAVAREAAAFVEQSTPGGAEILRMRDLPGVAVATAEGFNALKTFWQHTGLIVSSRQAEAWLEGRAPLADQAEVRDSLRQQLAGFYDCALDDVFLAPSGMAAQFAALRAVQERAPRRPTAQLGFPYVDTLKLQLKFGHGCELLHDLDRIAEELEAHVRRQPLAACFGEIPGNPLLGSADLRRITPILRQHGVPLVADDVVATPVNVDLSPHADLIATSLTKYVVGTADAMGGALICNPRSPYHAQLKAILAAQHQELLWGEDARVLDTQARGFPERMVRHNAHGLAIAERLRRHPAVERVYYPRWEFSDVYEAVRRPGGGWGALVTFLPRDAARTSPLVYDRLQVSKGPSLGTVFTLACPFTLLAHYAELEWAERCGVSRYLIRLSVGLEDPDVLWKRIEEALEVARPPGVA